MDVIAGKDIFFLIASFVFSCVLNFDSIPPVMKNISYIRTEYEYNFIAVEKDS
jgi:hypothetical protein